MYTGSFLEPTQFTVVKSTIDRTLRLQMGYGGDLVGSQAVRVGMEGLVWSRLRALPDFRFPVETADYFFGLYSRFSLSSDDSTRPYRFRIGHISSHLVDGTADTVVGGSSSHYSREFVSLEQFSHFALGPLQFRASYGVRYVFHQVTQVESAFQTPIVVELSLLPLFFHMSDSTRTEVLLGVSTADDPSGSSIAASITLRNAMLGKVCSDLYFTWRNGPPTSGTEAATSTNQFEVGLRIEPAF